MSVSLELDREARSRGIASQFVPTGQTGIAIAGWGISVDAVVSDFIAGAAEQLVVEGVERGGELLLVEGQGSVLHPAYSGVTLGLIHGSAPHAYVLCHQAGSTCVDGDERFPIPPLPQLVRLHEELSLIARPAPVLAVALNTRYLDDAAARAAIEAAGAGDGPAGRRSRALRRRKAAGRDLGGLTARSRFRQHSLTVPSREAPADLMAAARRVDARWDVAEENSCSWGWPWLLRASRLARRARRRRTANGGARSTASPTTGRSTTRAVTCGGRRRRTSATTICDHRPVGRHQHDRRRPAERRQLRRRARASASSSPSIRRSRT